MEHTILGASHAYTDPNIGSISTRLGGQWAYSPRFLNGKVIAECAVALTGYRRKDYAAAEAATRRYHAARRSVWHHVYDYNDPTVGIGKCTLQLVSWGDHVGTIPHAGGCRMYTAANGGRYRAPSPEGEEDVPVPEMPRYSKKELEEFCLRTGFDLSPALRRFYGGDFQLSRPALLRTARQDWCIDAVLPLSAESGASVESVLALRKAAPAALGLTGSDTPVAVDACGDMFFADQTGAVYFYDHEEGTSSWVDADLDALRE